MRHLVFVLAASTAMLNAMSMRRIAKVPSGPDAERVVCCDSDHDSMPELIFRRGTVNPSDPMRIEVWEHEGWNRLRLVFADTGAYPEPPGITIGNSIPFAAGDVDNDGLTDIVCITVEPDSTYPDTVYDDVITIESPDSFSYPSRLSWSYRVAHNFVIPFPTYYAPDLDGDGHEEIISSTPLLGTCIWENAGNDSNKLVWSNAACGGYFTFGDFNKDGRMDFVTGGPHPEVWENGGGDDQYQRVYQDTTIDLYNAYDVFMTHDVDGDGLPEFYVADEVVPRSMMHLYMWQANQAGSDVFHRTLVDSVYFPGDDWGRISECGDIDGDGIDECIWTTPAQINVYKAVGKDSLQRVWRWYSDHGSMQALMSTVYDVNNDGYKELITAGNNKISIFEVDAVDLVSPNGGDFRPGDTVSIRWVTHSPPRCDSLSLLLRRDSLWNLDTIAHGLPASDTLYRWVVPEGVPDTGRIVVIAYGGLPPLSSDENGGRTQSAAWQYDVSDSVVHFNGGGVAEGARTIPQQWSLSVSPNPARGAFTVKYDVPSLGAKAGTVPQSARTRGTVPVFALGIYDADGRLVRSLSEGDLAPGRYEARLRPGILPAGVYFCTLDNGAERISRKIVLTE